MSDVKVKFGAEDENLTGTLNKVQKELKQVEDQSKETNSKFSASFKGMATAAAGVALGIGAIKLAFNAVQGTVAAFGEALDMGGRLADLSARTGETAGKVLLLERAFTNAGSSAEKVGPTINKLQKFLMDAADGSDENAKALSRLGLSLSGLKNQSPTEQLRTIAEALSGVGDDGDRAGLAMKIFGRSGGELLPFLRDFGGGLSEAKEELGSMVAIMDAKAAVFDTVSDKIAVIKGKLTEFAAGILSVTVPALEFFTVALSRVDAAGLGQRLANAFIGGQEAMNGLTSALNALKAGEFSLSFEVAFASIKLQVKQTANEVYRNMSAAFSSVATTLLDILGPYSAIRGTLENTFVYLGKVLSRSLVSALAAVAATVPAIGAIVGGGLKDAVAGLDAEIAQASKRMNAYGGMIKDDLTEAALAFPKTFKDAYDSTKPLMDLTEDLKNVAKLQDEIGNKEVKVLNTEDDMIKNIWGSSSAIKDNLEEGAAAITKAATEVKEQLALSEQIMAKIREARDKEAVDPGGKLEKEASDALSKGDFKKAERAASKLKDREGQLDRKEDEEKDLPEEKRSDERKKKSGFQKSTQQEARDKGLDTFRKSEKELKKELENLTKDKLKKDLNKPGDDKARPVAGDGRPKQDALSSAVEKILALVAKIEPKLPQTALGA